MNRELLKTIAFVLLMTALATAALALCLAARVYADVPADALHDPLSAPGAAFDDLKAAQKLGWGLAVLAGLTMLSRVLGRFGGWFKFLAEGKLALAIGATGMFAATAYNAAVLGGSWFAALFGGLIAAAAWWDSHVKAPPATSPEPPKAGGA